MRNPIRGGVWGRLSRGAAQTHGAVGTTRVEEEKRGIEVMVRFYCRHHHGGSQLCSDCQQLLTYAHRRLDRCRFGEQKSTCRLCPVHCYSPRMAEQMRVVMRWAGPRMMLHHPVMAIKHLLREHLYK